MSNFSDDNKLRRYYSNVSAMGETGDLHTEATRLITERIEERMRSEGFDKSTIETYIAGLSSDTLVDLVPAACYMVMFLYFGGIDGEENRARAAFWEDRFEKAFRTLHIEVDTDSDSEPEVTFKTSARVFLG